jgi:magnesium chelatase family protein
MLASLRTAAVYGVEACPVQVEVDVSFGLPSFTMVGLPERPRKPRAGSDRDS